MTESGGLELIGIDKRYGDTTVLRGIDLTVKDGEFMTILGPSGSGKTTILRLIGGFIDPDGGEIRFDGEDINAVPIHLRPFNTVFQDYALFPHMTVERNVGYGLKVRGTLGDVIKRKVRDALDVVALGDLGRRYPAQLSGGQRQRVAMGRAIVRDAGVFLMDEPLSNLDAKLRVQIRTEIAVLQAQLGTTTVYVTHDQVEAMTLGQRVAVMREGRLQQVATPRDLYERPANIFVMGDVNSGSAELGL